MWQAPACLQLYLILEMTVDFWAQRGGGRFRGGRGRGQGRGQGQRNNGNYFGAMGATMGQDGQAGGAPSTNGRTDKARPYRNRHQNTYVKPRVQAFAVSSLLC
jgi:hypothetical protein